MPSARLLQIFSFNRRLMTLTNSQGTEPALGNAPRVRMMVPVWGTDYIERWLDLGFASLRSEGNIPYLNENCDLEIVMITKAADADRLRTDPRFNARMAGIRVDFVSLDEFLPPKGKVAYGVPLTL